VRVRRFSFAPGDQLGYGNTGFILAGQLIERVTGRPSLRCMPPGLRTRPQVQRRYMTNPSAPPAARR
jgi:hypothetical protein